MNFAWTAAGAAVAGSHTSRYMIEANGYLKVGDYAYTPTEDGKVGISKDICAANGLETMCRAYAKARPGDALDSTAATGGHVVLIVDKKVVYNSDGTINPDRSYFITLEQTPGPVSTVIQRHSWNEELQEIVYDIYIEQKISFRDCADSRIPITCEALISVEPYEEPGVTDSMDATEYSYENLLRGEFTATRMISTVTLAVSDGKGQVFSVTSSGIRQTIKTFNLQKFLTENYEGHMVLRGSLDLDKLIAGQNYHCTVTVILGSGDTITVRDFDFIATDQDISTPDPEDPGEQPPEEEEEDDSGTED